MPSDSGGRVGAPGVVSVPVWYVDCLTATRQYNRGRVADGLRRQTVAVVPSAVAASANNPGSMVAEYRVVENHEASPTFMGKYHFVIRRLHSLSGLVPVGVFLCFHLVANATVLMPGEPGAEFQSSIERIHALGPLLIPVEIVGIFLPLLFHTLLGFLIIFTGESNAQQYRYGGNLRYTLQRATGMIAFFFILYHLWQMHWLGQPLGGGAFSLHDEATGLPTGAATTAAAIQGAAWIAPLYVVGVLATVFHFANGVWTSLITWGITIRPKTQRTAGYICTALGIALAIVGVGAVRGFRTFVLDDTTTGADVRTTSVAAHAP